ncbi:MAG: hypothetical protein ACRC20_02105 [Segniliparus sp.]|uniref:hypothetical protein n=1 Tax=Segniliparus sp. TaxID=2804064 RepID=UPI003F373697
MTRSHVRRPERSERPGAAKLEKRATWLLWAALLVGGTVVGVFSLVIGTINVIASIVGASTGQNTGGWLNLVWYFVGGALLVVLPWSILAVVVSGSRRRRRVWFWPVAGLAAAGATTAGLASVYGFF